MRREEGSVSVVVAAVILVSLVLCLGVADVARVLIARSHARIAADAAALAVAQELVLPTGADPADGLVVDVREPDEFAPPLDLGPVVEPVTHLRKDCRS